MARDVRLKVRYAQLKVELKKLDIFHLNETNTPKWTLTAL